MADVWLPGQSGVGSVLDVEQLKACGNSSYQSLSPRRGLLVLSDDIVNAYDSASRHEIYKNLLAMRSPITRFFHWAFGRATVSVVQCKVGDIAVLLSRVVARPIGQ